MTRSCFLARYSNEPCEGSLIRAHLISRQTLKKEKLAKYIHDEATWVWACGELGLRGHHGAFDAYQLDLPRSAIPKRTEEFCAEHGLGWYLDRRYGTSGRTDQTSEEPKLPA
jgi:hypothetical protein